MSHKPEPGIAVGWKWLAGILTSVLILGGAAWMTTVASDSKEVRTEIAQLKKELSDKANDVNAIKKDIEIIKESQKDQRQSVKEVGDKVDKLKELIQDERFRARPRAN